MNAPDSGVLRHFKIAVAEMAGSSNSVQERLEIALSTQICIFRPADFPEGLRERWEGLIEGVLKHGESFPAATAKMNESTAQGFIDEIVDLLADIAKVTTDD